MEWWINLNTKSLRWLIINKFSIIHELTSTSFFNTREIMSKKVFVQIRKSNFAQFLFYFLCLFNASNNSSAASLVFTLNSTGTGGGEESGIGRQTNIIVFLFMRFVGMLWVNRVLSNKLPKAVSARTINCVFPFGVGFRYNIPTPLSLKLLSFFTKTLHL